MWEFASHQSPIYRQNKEASGRSGTYHNAFNGLDESGALKRLWETAHLPSMRGDQAERAGSRSYRPKKTLRAPTDQSHSGAFRRTPRPTRPWSDDVTQR